MSAVQTKPIQWLFWNSITAMWLLSTAPH